MSVSPNVVIMTLDELRSKEDAAFHRGVARGKFEAFRSKDERVARNCANWQPSPNPLIGTCNSCGSQIQHCEVGVDYKCPHWSSKP